MSTFIINGQNNYFRTDSLISVGIKLIDGGDVLNSRLCQLKKGDQTIRYSPYDVTEYGFKDGRVYTAKNVQVGDFKGRVFLERLYHGKISVYYYRKKGIRSFFIEKDSSLFVQIPKKDETGKHFSEQLLSHTNDCPDVHDACKLVSYRKKSFAKFFHTMNLVKQNHSLFLNAGYLQEYYYQN